MDRRSQASLAYRIITEVLVLAMVAAALVTGIATDWSFARLVPGLILYGVIFSFIVLSWWQLSSMYGVGVFRDKVSNVLGMLLAFNFTLMPLWLGFSLAGEQMSRSMIEEALLPVSFAVTGVLLALLIRFGQVYQSKHQWRLVHHSLWITSALLLASVFIPANFAFATVPVRSIVWLVIFCVPLAVRRLGVSLVANPARPPAPRPTSESAHAHSSSHAGFHAHSNESSRNSQGAGEETGSQENRERRYNRRGGQYRRRQGGGRRRM